MLRLHFYKQHSPFLKLLPYNNVPKKLFPSFSNRRLWALYTYNAPNDTQNAASSGTSLKSRETMDQYSRIDLRRDLIPKHVAICLDGSRRWLRAHGRPTLDYTPYFKSKVLFADLCLKWGVRTATSYVIGLGNMSRRSKDANDLFLGQFERFLMDNFDSFRRKGIRVCVVGETYMVSESLQTTIKQVEEGTKENKNLDYLLPVCYSGQRDITRATIKICEKVMKGVIKAEDINEDVIEKELTPSLTQSPPDLFIRTGGELRIGALLSWQVAHVELYFTSILAPDFQEDVFIDALRSFQCRDRKFGK